MADSPPPETLAWLRHAAAVDGAAYSQVLLHLLDRVGALEQRPIPGFVELAAPTPEAAPVARPEGDWFAVALVAQDMRSRGLAEQMAGDELLKLANCQPPTPEAAPVATDEELFSAYDAPYGFAPALRAVYDLGRQHGAAQLPAAQPAPPVAPAGGLVERVAEKMGPQSQAAMDAGELPYGAARAAIREVAAWLRSDYGGREGYGTSWANLIEEEANR
jgi:hypothetical protein